MSIEAVRFENFMAFRDTGWIELKPICLLFGRNSSGKSAIIRALRLLKQSLDSDDESQPLAFVTEEGVDVGNFRTVVHGQELTRNGLPQVLVFHFRCDLVNTYDHERIPSSSLTVDAVRRRVNARLEQRNLNPIPASSTPGILNLRLGFSWDDRDQHVVPVLVGIDCPWLEALDQNIGNVFEAKRESEPLVPAREIQEAGDLEADRWTWPSEWILSSDLLLEYHRIPEEADFSGAMQSVSGFLPVLAELARIVPEDSHSESDFQLVQNILQAFRTIIRLYLEGLQHLGPIRPEPRRIYMLDRHEKRRWESQGMSAFLDFLEGNVDTRPAKRIGTWLHRLDLGTGAEEEKYYDHELGLVANVHVTEAKDRQPINLLDFGSGAAQVLPVVVQATVARPGTLTVIEQPELHLHPRAQAQLTDVFVDAVYYMQKKSDDEDEIEPHLTSVRFLLETHSEHVFLRLRRRIAESATGRHNTLEEPSKYFAAEALTVYFVHRKANGVSTVEEVAINQYGDILNIPFGFEKFFADDLLETVAISKARPDRE